MVTIEGCCWDFQWRCCWLQIRDMHVSGWSLISDCCVTRMVQWFASQQEKLCAVGKWQMTRFYKTTINWWWHISMIIDTKGREMVKGAGVMLLMDTIVDSCDIEEDRQKKRVTQLTWIMCMWFMHNVDNKCWGAEVLVVLVAPFTNSCPPSATESERKNKFRRLSYSLISHLHTCHVLVSKASSSLSSSKR